MEVKIFTVPIFDEGSIQDEMNRFLRGHKVLEMEQKLVTHGQNSYWTYSIRYVTGATVAESRTKKEKIDYRDVLDERTFGVFSRLRELRKEIAQAEAIPVYAVFTNAELAKIAELEEMSGKNLTSINGIGKNKMEKYGNRIIAMYKNNEKS